MPLFPFPLLSVPCSGCEHGRWNCSLEHCPVDGGLSAWSSWSGCSLSCGGLGLKTRTRGCTQPAPAHGGRDCQGPRQETTYCQAPDCPGTGPGRGRVEQACTCACTCVDFFTSCWQLLLVLQKNQRCQVSSSWRKHQRVLTVHALLICFPFPVL